MWLRWNVDKAEVRLAGLMENFWVHKWALMLQGLSRATVVPKGLCCCCGHWHSLHAYSTLQNLEHTGFTAALVETHRHSFWIIMYTNIPSEQVVLWHWSEYPSSEPQTLTLGLKQQQQQTGLHGNESEMFHHSTVHPPRNDCHLKRQG